MQYRIAAQHHTDIHAGDSHITIELRDVDWSEFSKLRADIERVCWDHKDRSRQE